MPSSSTYLFCCNLLQTELLYHQLKKAGHGGAKLLGATGGISMEFRNPPVSQKSTGYNFEMLLSHVQILQWFFFFFLLESDCGYVTSANLKCKLLGPSTSLSVENHDRQGWLCCNYCYNIPRPFSHADIFNFSPEISNFVLWAAHPSSTNGYDFSRCISWFLGLLYPPKPALMYFHYSIFNGINTVCT